MNKALTLPTWTIGDRMTKARRSAGIQTSGEMARRLGVSRNTISAWENDHTKPSQIVLRVWADETGVPLWWLEGFESEDAFIRGYPCPGQGQLALPGYVERPINTRPLHLAAA